MAESILTDDLFGWIPRWRDKLVLEAWSLGTFMRLDWWEKNQAQVAQIGREKNEEEWHTVQGAHIRELGQERRSMHKASREHEARIRAKAEELARNAAAEETRQLEMSKQVMKKSAQLLAAERAADEAHLAEEARVQKFERNQREKREAAEAYALREKQRTAEADAKRAQRELTSREAEEQAKSAEKLAHMREEKRQQLFDEAYRQSVHQAQVQEADAHVYNARQRLHAEMQKHQQSEERLAAIEATEKLQAQWDADMKARDKVGLTCLPITYSGHLPATHSSPRSLGRSCACDVSIQETVICPPVLGNAQPVWPINQQRLPLT